jgi:hypothetical protein
MAVLDVEINGNPAGLNNALNQSAAGLTNFSRNGIRSIQSLQIQLQSYQRIAANATDPAILRQYNSQIEQTQSEITRLSNVGRTGFDNLGNAITQNTGALSSAYSVIRTIANVLPGLGIAGVIGFAVEPLIEYISNLEIIKGTAREIASETAFASEPYKKALTDVTALGVSLTEFHSGIVSGKKVINDYNDTIGKTSGKLNNVQEIEDFYNSKSKDYVQAVLLRARAQAQLQTAVEETIKVQKRASSNSAMDYLGATLDTFGGAITGRFIGDKSIVGNFKEALKIFQKRDVDELKKNADSAVKVYSDLQKEADKFNQRKGINLDAEDIGNKTTVKLSDIQETLRKALEKTEVQLGSTYSSRNLAQIAAYQSAIDSATDAFGRQSKAVQDLQKEQARLLTLDGIQTLSGSVNQGLPAQRNSLGQKGIEGIGVQDKSLSAFKATLKANEIDGKQAEKLANNLNRQLTRAVDTFGGDFLATINNINQQTDRSIGGIVGGLTESLSYSLNEVFATQFKETITDLAKGTKVSFKDASIAIAGTVGNLISGITNKTSTLGQGAGGALSGVAAGASLGKVLVPIGGGLIGGAIGGLVGAIGGIFGASKAKKQEKLAAEQLAESQKQTRLLERQNALAYTSSIIGRMTTSGVVTGVEVNEFGQLTTKISGQDLQITLDRANKSRQRGT